LEVVLGSDCEFDKKDLSKLIHEHPNDSEKKLYDAISKRISNDTEKTKTDSDEKKGKEFDQRQALSKKRK
jgi:hypothetical protein